MNTQEQPEAIKDQSKGVEQPKQFSVIERDAKSFGTKLEIGASNRSDEKTLNTLESLYNLDSDDLVFTPGDMVKAKKIANALWTIIFVANQVFDLSVKAGCM